MGLNDFKSFIGIQRTRNCMFDNMYRLCVCIYICIFYISI